MLQLVALLTAPVTAIYALGGLLASPVIIPAIILKNLAVLVRAHLRMHCVALPTCNACMQVMTCSQGLDKL